MRVHSWWSIGCGRSNGCTCWRGYTYFSASVLSWKGSLSDCQSAGAVAPVGGGVMVEKTAAIIAMKNGMEGRFISRGEHGDGLLYFRGNRCGWHLGGRDFFHWWILTLTINMVTAVVTTEGNQPSLGKSFSIKDKREYIITIDVIMSTSIFHHPACSQVSL